MIPEELADAIAVDREPQTGEGHLRLRELKLEAMGTVVRFFRTDIAGRWEMYEALGLVPYRRGKFRIYQFGRPLQPPDPGQARKSGRSALPGRRAGKARAK